MNSGRGDGRGGSGSRRGGSGRSGGKGDRSGSGRGDARGRGSSGGGRRVAGVPPRSGRSGSGGGRRGDGREERSKGPGGDQVEGRHAVRELLLAGRRRVREVVMAADLDPAPIVDEIIELATEGRVSVTQLSRAKFESLTRTEASQGVMARADPLPDLDLDDLLARSDDPPFLLVLDGITDPGNLGAMLRTGMCAGVTGVVLPRHRSARITPTVTKAAAGAIEHLPVATVSGIPAALGDLAARGVWTVGLDAVASTSVYDMAVSDAPVALVLGAEGRGLSRLARERCDLVVAIPLQGPLGSLNVGAAAAVACFEVARRRAG